MLGRGAAGRAPVAAGTFRSGTAAPDTGHSAGISAHGAGSAVADSAGMLAGAGVAGVDGLRLAAVVSLYRSRIPAAPLPSGRNRKTAGAGVAEHPAADAAAANRDALPVRGIPAGANRRPPHRGCSVSVLGGAAVGAGGAVSAGLGLCLSGAVVCALCLLCPSGTAALESARCCHADHARRSAGTAGTAGVVCPANAAAGDAPVGAAESGAVGDGVLQSAVPSVV